MLRWLFSWLDRKPVEIKPLVSPMHPEVKRIMDATPSSTPAVQAVRANPIRPGKIGPLAEKILREQYRRHGIEI